MLPLDKIIFTERYDKDKGIYFITGTITLKHTWSFSEPANRGSKLDLREYSKNMVKIFLWKLVYNDLVRLIRPLQMLVKMSDFVYQDEVRELSSKLDKLTQPPSY